MKLVYKSNGKAVQIGDVVYASNGDYYKIYYFRKPSSPASEGKVTVVPANTDKLPCECAREYYVSVFGIEWIDREDRLPKKKFVFEPEEALALKAANNVLWKIVNATAKEDVNLDTDIFPKHTNTRDVLVAISTLENVLSTSQN